MLAAIGGRGYLHTVLECEDYYPKAIVLLGAEQPICRTVTLKALVSRNILVYRRSK